MGFQYGFSRIVLGHTYCSKQCLGIYLRRLLVACCPPKSLRTPARLGRGLILFSMKSDAFH